MATRQTPLRNAFQNDIESNIEYGEAVFALLKRKAENQLELIAPAHKEGLPTLFPLTTRQLRAKDMKG
jgi:hypothetical protein